MSIGLFCRIVEESVLSANLVCCVMCYGPFVWVMIHGPLCLGFREEHPPQHVLLQRVGGPGLPEDQRHRVRQVSFKMAASESSL